MYPRTFCFSRRSAGFTLLELLVTLAIVGVLAGVAFPSLRSLVVGERVKTASFDLVASLTMARSEAIKWNGNVTIAPISAAWTNGWTITSPGGTTGDIKTQSAFTKLDANSTSATAVPQVTITGPTSVVYNRSGRLASAGSVTFQVSDSAAASTIQPRCVTVGLTGQPTTKGGSC